MFQAEFHSALAQRQLDFHRRCLADGRLKPVDVPVPLAQAV
jgi:hypothetical protein